MPVFYPSQPFFTISPLDVLLFAHQTPYSLTPFSKARFLCIGGEDGQCGLDREVILVFFPVGVKIQWEIILEMVDSE